MRLLDVTAAINGSSPAPLYFFSINFTHSGLAALVGILHSASVFASSIGFADCPAPGIEVPLGVAGIFPPLGMPGVFGVAGMLPPLGMLGI